MTVQDFLCRLLWMIQDFKVVRVSFNQSVSALRAFRRDTVLRFFMWNPRNVLLGALEARNF